MIPTETAGPGTLCEAFQLTAARYPEAVALRIKLVAYLQFV